MKNVYFLSDAHLGSRAIEHGRTQERRLVNFLDSIKYKASAVYLLGDMFDFWYEFKTVVPKGYTRFLGKLSELTDIGVEVHFFTGNHDIWCGDYLTKECGVIMHREPLTTEIYVGLLTGFAQQRDLRLLFGQHLQQLVHVPFILEIALLLLAAVVLYHQVGHGGEHAFAAEAAGAHGHPLEHAGNAAVGQVIPAVNVKAVEVQRLFANAAGADLAAGLFVRFQLLFIKLCHAQLCRFEDHGSSLLYCYFFCAAAAAKAAAAAGLRAVLPPPAL